MGFDVLVIWDSDYKNNKQEIINRLKTVRQFLVDIKNEF